MDLITKNYKETIIKCKNNKNCHGDMLIIHGFGTNHWHLYKLALKLSENFNIYLIDLPGHGDNIDGFNKKHMKITFFVEYVIEYIKHKQFKNLFLMGHSMGGGICCGVASIIPETIKKLILICPANPGSIAAGPKLLKMFFPKTWQDNLKFQKLLYHPNNYENFIKDEVWLKNHNDNFLWQKENSKNLHKLFINMTLATFFYFKKAIKQITTPTILFTGEYDDVVPFKSTLRFFKKAFINKKDLLTTFTFQNSGHIPFEEEQPLFITELLKI